MGESYENKCKGSISGAYSALRTSKSQDQYDVNYYLGLELKEEDAEKVANCFYLFQKKIAELEAENKALQNRLAGHPEFIIKVSLSDGRADDEKGKPNKLFSHPFDYSAMLKFTRENPWQLYKVSIHRSPFKVDSDRPMIVSGSALRDGSINLIKLAVRDTFHQSLANFLELQS